MPIFVSNDFPPAYGGIQRLIFRLAEQMSLSDRETIVVAPNLEGSRAVDDRLPYRVLRYAIAPFKPLMIVSIAYSYVKALRLARTRATIASIWWPAGFAVAIVPGIFRGPFIVLAHGSEIAPSVGGLRRLLMRFVYAQASAVLTNSRFTTGLLNSVGVRRNVRGFPMGVDFRHIALARTTYPTILSVGRLVKRKGFDKTIEAVARLSTDFPTLRYEIIGDGPQARELRELAQKFGVLERIDFLGSVEDAQMWEAYGRAWCFSLPTRNVEDDVEGFGIVYLEAAMAELPSIGGTGSGAVDAIVDGVTGFLVDGTSVDEITGALRKLLEDRALAENLGREARRRAETEFTWANAAAAVSRSLPS